MATQCPKNTVFGPKLAFLGFSWAKNGHFFLGGGLNHPFSGSHTLQHIFI